MRIPYVDPRDFALLDRDGDVLIRADTRVQVARIINDIPRFVSVEDNYAETFGWQWKKWENNQSEARGSNIKQRQLILDRTHFDKYVLNGKVILECGMGGGDDTEVLLTLPFAEIHSFDLSSAVERAAKYLKDPRLFISQASIYAIPYGDRSFDYVFCHRVLQHTPDPENALRAMCKKVKPGGVLFIHSYKRSKEYMCEWRYKYRWLTTRLPKKLVYLYVQYLGRIMHYIVNRLAAKSSRSEKIAYRWLPFYRVVPVGVYADLKVREIIELEKMITFDALTPKYDYPMTTSQLKTILHDEGFHIDYLEDSLPSPVYATARKHIQQ